MNAEMTMTVPDSALDATSVLQATRQACERIAPNWPLDQLIAVNPWWPLRDRPMAEAAGELSWLGGVRCFLSPDTYRKQGIPESVMAAVLAEQGVKARATDFMAADPARPETWQNLDQLFDRHRDLTRQVSWREEIQHQLSQFAGRYFADPQAAFYQGDFYEAWLKQVRNDHGLAILMGEPGLAKQFKALPERADVLVTHAMEELQVPQERLTDYAHALLLSLNGWASTASYHAWQAALAGSEDDTLHALLAARLAWELVLWRQLGQRVGAVRGDWLRQLARAEQVRAAHLEYAAQLHCWQLASERLFQQDLQSRLSRPWSPPDPATPVLQAVFCIDTRSEVMRRALEAEDDRIQTRGFAGFFGLPIAYQSGAYQRPQLPGLLAPQLQASAAGQDKHEPGGTSTKGRWLGLAKSATGGFSLVESSGLAYGLAMLRNTFGWRSGASAVKPAEKLQLCRDGEPLSPAEQAELALGVLKAMGFEDQFSRWVLLVGHGSDCHNNPHAAGLDCGACGGQSGEVNVRLLAQMLNDGAVREAIAEQGLEIPAQCEFIPALHNTTTDEIRILAGTVDAEVAQWLDNARARCADERARYLDTGTEPAVVAVARRARDWSQVRPEWGLANNACFVVADRARTRHLDLGGRSFLHDYQWQKDPESALLTQILTAPMIVTNWINMQYNASVTEPFLYGSGNKTLHNVVGGNLGVFEGNGGDLRIGLPLQSVHDGRDWMHQPLRLSVYVDAPQSAIADIVAAHDDVRWLVDNQWLYLFQLTDEGGCRYFQGRWESEAASEMVAVAP